MGHDTTSARRPSSGPTNGRIDRIVQSFMGWRGRRDGEQPDAPSQRAVDRALTWCVKMAVEGGDGRLFNVLAVVDVAAETRPRHHDMQTEAPAPVVRVPKAGILCSVAPTGVRAFGQPIAQQSPRGPDPSPALRMTIWQL